MTLDQLKRTIARVEIGGESNGTAFLVDRNHVATAHHVLNGHRQVDLVFPEWIKRDRKRVGTFIWQHLAGHDVAVLRLDRECPDDLELIAWTTAKVGEGDEWSSPGFPSLVPVGHTVGGKVRDPSLHIEAWDLRVLQLETQSAEYDLGGMSGAPCIIGGALVGVITRQLRRSLPGGKPEIPEPSLNTLYALPISLLFAGPVAPPLFEQDDTLPSFKEMIRMAEALAPEAKASVLAKILRALDRTSGSRSQARRAAIASRLGEATRLVVHVIWRDGNAEAERLAQDVYKRMTRSSLANTSPGVRVPTFLHNGPGFLSGAEPRPIDPARVEHSVIVLLLDDAMFGDEAWRACHERIVELSERDVVGTSVLPVGVDGPKWAAPFRSMFVSDLTGPANLLRLLVALEVHLVRVLERNYADAGERKCVRLFLSHAKEDGRKYPLAVRDLARATRGVEALMDEDELGPGDRFTKLLENLPGSVLLAFVTPRFDSRPWCRREWFEAKRLGLPMLMVDAQEGDVARVFPYRGNVPCVRWRKDSLDAYTVLEAATFVALGEKYGRLLLEDQTLLDASLRDATIVTRPPELFDLVARGGLLSRLAKRGKPVVLHPDPPLSEEEQEVLRDVRDLRVVSPGLALAEAQPLRRAGSGRSLRIALSASSPDVFRAGLTMLHFEDTWLDLIRMLLLGGANLAFGGDLREEGLTHQLLEVAEQRTEIEQRARRTKSAPPTRLRQPALIRSYLAWPIYFALTEKRRTDLIDRVEFELVPPPSSSVASYPATKVPPDTAERRYLWTRSLTRMRCKVIQDMDAMVVIGGKCTGFAGRYAGVVEESLLAIQRRKPVFVLGAIGGAAEVVGEALLGKRPYRLSSAFQLDPEIAPGELAHVAYYNEKILCEPEVDAPGAIDHEAVIGELNRTGLNGFAGLNNGLSESENRLLLASPSMQDVVPLLLKGLCNLLGSQVAALASPKGITDNHIVEAVRDEQSDPTDRSKS